eukprot:1930-Heterococcus_DN1.PRE.4
MPDVNAEVVLAFALPLLCLVAGFSVKHDKLCESTRVSLMSSPLSSDLVCAAKASSNPKDRPMSFTSGVMTAGSNPDSWGSPMPVINACLYYDTLPTEEALKEAALKHQQHNDDT